MTAPETQSLNLDKFTPYEEIANKHLRTMRITTDARFEAAKRLKLINLICFLTTTIASLGLILIPLLDIAGINKIFSGITLTVIQVFLAVCVLVYSTAIATANFQVRSKEFLQCGDRIKSIVDEFKVHLVDVRERDIKPDLEKYMNEYREVLRGFENHEDIDYRHAYSVFKAKERKGESKTNDTNAEDNKKESSCKLSRKILIYTPSVLIVSIEVLIIFFMLGSYFLCC